MPAAPSAPHSSGAVPLSPPAFVGREHKITIRAALRTRGEEAAVRSSYGERTWPLTPARASRGAHVTSENTGLTPFRLMPSRRRDRLTSSCALSPCGKGSVTQHVHEQLPASRASLPSPSRACSKKEQAHQKPACSRNEHFKCQWPTADVCRWRGSPRGFAAARWDSIVTLSHTEGNRSPDWPRHLLHRRAQPRPRPQPRPRQA